jgi:ribosomal-protein-alanine N-acetyltransferase
MVRKEPNSKKLVIRKACESDIPFIVEIENLSFSTPWSESLLCGEIHKHNSISRVAVIEGEKVAGYIMVNQILDEAHILNLAVHPEVRRTGTASALIENIIKDLRKSGCRLLHLEVRDSNRAAYNLYEKFNAEIVGSRKNYYLQPQEDAILMLLRI